MKTKILMITFVLAFFSASVLGQKNTSIYSNLDTKYCKTLESDTSGAGYYRGRCPGIAGYKLDVIEGDIRQTIDVIAPNKKKFELGFWSFFGSFSSVGQKAEWRMKGKIPVALIVRFNVADPEDSTKNTSYLMVSKITKTKICVTDVVNPSSSQNAEAQKLADLAITKPCKSTQ